MRGDLVSPLQQQIAEKLPWLFEEFRLKVVGDTYDPKAFGDCVVTMESASIRLRFVRDRGQILLDLASLLQPDRWWNILFVLEAIHGRKPVPSFELEWVGSILRENFLALVDALGPKLQETRRELERHAEERVDALRQKGLRAAAAKKSWADRLWRN